MSNCHINAKNFGIYANNCTEATIAGNLFYGNDESQSDLIGVLLSGTIPAGSSFFNIVGNSFHNTNVSKAFTAVKIAKGSYGLIDINIFRRATTAIWLTSGASNCKVGASNTYGSAVTTKVLNQGTNNTIKS